MTIKADLHNHFATSAYTGDTDKVIDLVAKRLGKGWVCGLVNVFTGFKDHTGVYEDFVSKPGTYDRINLGNAIHIPEKDITIAKGEEIRTNQGDVLFFGLQEGSHLTSSRNLEDTLQEAQDNNGIIIADHPFYHLGIGEYLEQHPELLEELDAIEIYNGEAGLPIPYGGVIPFNANSKAENFFNQVKKDYPNLGGLVTSDGHSLYELGQSHSVIDDVSTQSSEEFTKTLRTAIRNHKSFENDRKARLIGKLGALQHVIALATGLDTRAWTLNK